MKLCRDCAVPLTLENARRHDGRWVGRCRECERAANVTRKRSEVDRRVRAELGPLQDAWNFVVWCSQQDYRGPMPEHVRRARDLLNARREAS